MSGAELQTIRSLAAANRIMLSDHARKRMSERNVSYNDVRKALTNAHSCRPADGTNWRATGPDLDGEQLVVIVAIEGDVVVVTVF